MESDRPSSPLVRFESDWFRTWPIFDSGGASGDEIRPDVGRVVTIVGCGEGEGVFREKGLFREFRAPGRPLPALIVVVLWVAIWQVRLCLGPSKHGTHYADCSRQKEQYAGKISGIETKYVQECSSCAWGSVVVQQ